MKLDPFILGGVALGMAVVSFYAATVIGSVVILSWVLTRAWNYVERKIKS